MNTPTHKYIKTILGIACSLWLAACQPTSTPQQEASTGKTYQRIVSLSGAITETLYTLGHGDKIVGVDVTSTYPADANALPKLGHVRQLNAEGILGLKPDLIIAEMSENNSPSLQQLGQSGVEILWLEKPNSLDAPLQIATKLVEKLGDSAEKLPALSQKMGQERQELQAFLTNKTNTPKVLFIYARGKGNLMVAGKNTPAEAMISAAGGKNAVTEFDDFQALSAEGLIKAQPDVILMFDSGLQSLNGTDELLKVPGVNQTPAGKNRRVITMDGHYLLGFGPRATQAALDLAKQLQSTKTL